MFCSAPYRLAERRLHGSQRLRNPMRAPATARGTLNQPGSFESTTLKDLHGFMLSTLPGKDEVKEGSNCCLWNLIFYAAVESVDKPGSDRGIAHYTSTNRLLTSYVEKGESQIKFARKRHTLAAW